MDLQNLATSIDLSIKAMLLLLAGVSAFMAIGTYRLSTRTKAAEFLLSLHGDYFADAKYKSVREVLDADSPSSSNSIATFIAEEGDDFTSFLNFFELVTYLSLKTC